MAKAPKRATKRAPKPTVIKWLRPPDRFGHCVSIDYDTVKRCDCSDRCNCSTIDNAHVESVYAFNVERIFFDGDRATKTKSPFIDNEIAEYVTGRVVAARRLEDKENFDIGIHRGYYGEEIGEITLDYGFTDMCLFMESMEKMSTLEMINAALIEEYGYILEDLKHKDYDGVQTIDLSDIKRQSEHYQRVDRDTVSKYKEHFNEAEGEYILGVVLKVAELEYRLIDGYHRTAASEMLGHTNGKYIVFKEDDYQYNDDDGH